MFLKHYYYQKYPYLNYNFHDYDGKYIMFSIPPEMLISAFKNKIGRAPKTFFDCGAATGEIVWRAGKLGMNARGIDVKRYPYQTAQLEDLFKQGKIKICSILDHEPVGDDLVFCNGTLTYFGENDISRVLEKFRNCGMLCAIHNTAEDVEAAQKQNCILSTCSRLRLVQTREWWLKTFDKNGYTTDYNSDLQCFCAVPRQQAKEH